MKFQKQNLKRLGRKSKKEGIVKIIKVGQAESEVNFMLVLRGIPFSESGHRYNLRVFPECSGQLETGTSDRGFMPEVATVSKPALVMPVEIPAILRLQHWLVDLQLFDAVGEKAALSVAAVPALHVSLAELDLALGALAGTAGRC